MCVNVDFISLEFIFSSLLILLIHLLFIFPDSCVRAPQVPPAKFMEQVYNLTSALVPWVQFLWFLTQKLVSGAQASTGAGHELDRSVHVNRYTLLESCRESLNLVEGLNRLVVVDVSPLPARDRRVCCHSVPSAVCLG